jgi:hypothetical protein
VSLTVCLQTNAIDRPKAGSHLWEKDEIRGRKSRSGRVKELSVSDVSRTSRRGTGL